MMYRTVSLLFLATALGALENPSALSPRAVRNCAACHPAQAGGHPATSMAHALELTTECGILRSHPLMTFTEGPFSYRIERKGSESFYTVSGGQQTVTVPIRWAFGLGAAGQTYVFERDGDLYQTRVSYFSEIDALDLTLGAQNIKPAGITDALGMLMTRDEKVGCFNCHATNATEGMQLTLAGMSPGIQCERCHGSTVNHLEGVQRGDAQPSRMRSLKSLSSEEMSNFCGQCHRTWDQIAVQGKLGVVDVRFQPYRLTNSKCYDAANPLISCVACHDPHHEINRNTTSYDSHCLACHAGDKPQAKVCKTANSECVSCHMPKIEIPGSHHKFSDHQIRIVRAHESYPD